MTLVTNHIHLRCQVSRSIWHVIGMPGTEYERGSPVAAYRLFTWKSLRSGSWSISMSLPPPPQSVPEIHHLSSVHLSDQCTPAAISTPKLFSQYSTPTFLPSGSQPSADTLTLATTSREELPRQNPAGSSLPRNHESLHLRLLLSQASNQTDYFLQLF